MGAVTTWYAFDETLNAFRYFMPVSGDCWSLGRFAGMNRPDDTAAYLAERVQQSPYAGTGFYIWAASGTNDSAYREILLQIEGMARLNNMFNTANMTFHQKEGARHEFRPIPEYLYNALPFFFPKVMNKQKKTKTFMNSFTYRYPVRQHFGKGCAENAIKEELDRIGQNVLLAYGGSSLKRTGLYDKIISWLHERGKNVVDFGGIMPNPTYDKVQEGARLVREHDIDFILAVGGGSVIDCCKVVSAQVKLDEDIWEMQYTKHQYPTEFVPMGAIVTASGTGAEQNNGAVITHTEKKLKQPLTGAYYSFAILDSDLTRTLPMGQVVSVHSTR